MNLVKSLEFSLIYFGLILSDRYLCNDNVSGTGINIGLGL